MDARIAQIHGTIRGAADGKIICHNITNSCLMFRLLCYVGDQTSSLRITLVDTMPSSIGGWGFKGQIISRCTLEVYYIVELAERNNPVLFSLLLV